MTVSMLHAATDTYHRDRQPAWRTMLDEPTRLDQSDRAAAATFAAFDEAHTEAAYLYLGRHLELSEHTRCRVVGPPPDINAGWDRYLACLSTQLVLAVRLGWLPRNDRQETHP